MKKLAYCFSDWDYTIARKVTDGVNEFLREQDDVQVLCFHEIGYFDTSATDPGQNKIFELATKGDFDGYVIQANRTWPHEARAAFIRNVRKKRPDVPVATIDEYFPGCIFVGTDNYASEYEMVHVLLSKIDAAVMEPEGIVYGGIRSRTQSKRAVFVSSHSDSRELQEREKGFVQACKDAHIPPEQVQIMHAEMTEDAGISIATHLLQNPDHMPNIVACAYDIVANAVANTFLDTGIRIPEDIVICGFDNFDLSRNFDKRLVSVERDDAGVVKKALEMVMEADGPDSMNQKVFIPYNVIYEEMLPNGTLVSEAGAEELRTELIRSRRLNILQRKAENNYYKVRDQLEKELSRAKTMSEIMDSFEKGAKMFHWGNLYVMISTDYRYGMDRSADLSHYPEKMALTAVVGDMAGKWTPDPVTHVYTVFNTNEIFPQMIENGKNCSLMCLRCRLTSSASDILLW